MVNLSTIRQMMAGAILVAVAFVTIAAIYFALWRQRLIFCVHENMSQIDQRVIFVVSILIAVALLNLVAIVVLASVVRGWLRSGYVLKAHAMVVLCRHLGQISVVLACISVVIGCILLTRLDLFNVLILLIAPVICIVNMLWFLTRAVRLLDPAIWILPTVQTVAPMTTGYMPPVNMGQTRPAGEPVWPYNSFPPARN